MSIEQARREPTCRTGWKQVVDDCPVCGPSGPCRNQPDAEAVREAAAKVVEDYADFAPGDDLPLGTAQAFLHSAMNAIRAMPLPQTNETVALLREARDDVRAFVGAAYPVADVISPRGYNWSAAYLDSALPNARATLSRIDAHLGAK